MSEANNSSPRSKMYMNPEWTLFSDHHPFIGQPITLEWNIGGEFDCIWTNEIDWKFECAPLKWKPLKIIFNSPVDFFEQIVEILEEIKRISPSKFLDAFFYLRYRLLHEYFPHAPFGVEQAEHDFFTKTLSYIKGELNISEIKSSEYNLNYVNWLKRLE